MKINKLIIIFLLFSFENFKHLSAKELDSHYEEYLEQADKYLSTYKFCNSKEKNEKMENDCSETISASYLKLTKEKLEKLETEYPAPDYRFFGLRGMLYEELGKIDLATEDYEKALSLKPNEKNIAKRLFEIYGEDRRPQKAFNFARIYLSQDPENKLIRYRALILASRLGERKYFNFSLSKIEASKKSNSLETILKEVDKLISKKDFKQCKNILDESILLYPTSLKLHNQSIQVERKINSSKNEMEKLLLDKAAIFYTEKKYSLELAMFYKENNRKYEALNLYRRMFHQAIKKQGYNFE
jgi:hypothetical protein